MPDFHFYLPLTVRYSDLDPQGHVNNARYLSYLEEGRIAYIRHLGLWDGRSFLDVGIILVEARLTYRAPILIGQPLQVGVRVRRIGGKSFEMEYVIEDTDDRRLLATGLTTLVTYDYRNSKTMPVPQAWRQAIHAFEADLLPIPDSLEKTG